MKKALEKFGNECFAEKCAAIDTREEKTLVKQAVEKYKMANNLLTTEQSVAVEEYVDALCKFKTP